MNENDRTEKIEQKPELPAAEKPGSTELSDKSLEQISGGVGHAVSVNRSKVANKAADAVDAYIRG